MQRQKFETAVCKHLKTNALDMAFQKFNFCKLKVELLGGES